MNKSLIFFGNERLATGVTTSAPTLRGLIESGWSIEAVVVNNAEVQGRRKRTLEVAEIANSHDIPILSSADVSPDRLKTLGADAGILAAYGQIVSKELIDIFPRGIINIHPSLLPMYRGSTPIEQAILEGVKQTGVSLMKLVPKMDAGPVYIQEKIDLTGHETKQELADRLGNLGSRIMLANLEGILNNTLELINQVESEATYTRQLTKNDGFIDLAKPAELLEREIRAYAGWPRSRIVLFGHEIIITKARLSQNRDGGRLILECAPGFLEVIELVAPSGKTMSGHDFLLGYKR